MKRSRCVRDGMRVERTEVHSINRRNLATKGLHDETCHSVADISEVVLVLSSLIVSLASVCFRRSFEVMLAHRL